MDRVHFIGAGIDYSALVIPSVLQHVQGAYRVYLKVPARVVNGSGDPTLSGHVKNHIRTLIK
jgi:hypothetical protein